MTMLFLTNADFLLKFYERCAKDGIETEEERVVLLTQMAIENEGQCSISQTNRTKEQVVKDLSKNYGKVLCVDPDKKD